MLLIPLPYKPCAEELAWVFGTRRGGSPGWVYFLLNLLARFPRPARYFPARGPFLSLRDGARPASRRPEPRESPPRVGSARYRSPASSRVRSPKSRRPGGAGASFLGSSEVGRCRRERREWQFGSGASPGARKLTNPGGRCVPWIVGFRSGIPVRYPAPRKSPWRSPLSCIRRSSEKPPIGRSPTRIKGTV